MKRSYFALPRRIKTATYASEELEWLHSRPKHFKSTPQLRANKDRESDFCKTKADKRRREGERYFIGAHKSNWESAIFSLVLGLIYLPFETDLQLYKI